MSPTEDFGAIPERARRQAADWFARMHGPGAEAWRDAFEAWLANRGNARAYDQLTGRWEQSAFIGATELGRERGLRRASFVARYPALAAAAALIVLVGGTGLYFAERGHDAKTKVAASSRSQRFETGAALREVALSDGSRVTLDRMSLVLVSYSPERRELQLERGRARFEVAHDARRPFVVDAGVGEVTAHGTLFDVTLRGNAVTVTLLTGAITVRPRAAATSGRLLHAGQQILVPAHRPLPDPVAAPADADAWLPRMIAFDGTPLADAAARLDQGRPHLLFADDIGSLRITGAFKAGDIEALAQAAAAMFDLKLERKATGDLLLTRPAQAAAKKSGG